MKITKKEFREKLNREDSSLIDGVKWKHNQYGQRKRLYGDYLYSQDRIKFDVLYKEFTSSTDNKTK